MRVPRFVCFVVLAWALAPMAVHAEEPAFLDTPLVGTVVVEGGRSFAFFQPRGRVVLTREGDDVVPGLRLAEVRRDRVIVEQGGERREIFLDGASRGSGPASPTPTARPAPPEPTDTDEPVRQVGEFSWEVDGPGVAMANPGLGRVLAQVAVAPHVGPDGPDGLEVTFVGEGGLFHQLGFRAGDIVSEVNGTPIRSADDAHAAYGAATKAGAVAVEVLREGVPRTFTYQLR